MARNYSNITVQTSLVNPIGSSDTTLEVDNSTGMPTSFPFSLILDYESSNVEVVTVTGLSGSSFTVVRGQDGTGAQAHDAGAIVVHGATARDLFEPQEHIDDTSDIHGVGSGSDVVGTATTQVLTNKTISSGSNTITLALDDLTDATTSGALNGDSFVFDGLIWEPQTIDTGAPSPHDNAHHDPDFATADHQHASGDSGNVLGGTTAGLGELAVHPTANADGSGSVAVGNSADAGGIRATALGPSAFASHDFSTALGDFAITTADLQIMMGDAGFDIPNVEIPGDLNVSGSKNFTAPHPDDPTREVRHSSYEGPVPGGTVYRYRVTTQDRQATIQLPDYFAGLNTDVDVHVSPVRHFGHAYGETNGNTLTITVESDGEYAVLVLGTRNDPAARRAWEHYQDVKPEGMTWHGRTKDIRVIETDDDEMTVQRVYRAPAGECTERRPEHFRERRVRGR